MTSSAPRDPDPERRPPRRWGLPLVLALILGTSVALAMTWRRPLHTPERPGPLVVLVATRDLPAGATVAPGDVAKQRFAEPAPRFVRDGLRGSLIHDVVGMRVVEGLQAGDVLMPGFLEEARRGR